MDYVQLLKRIMRLGKNVNPRGIEIKELLGVRLNITNDIFFDFGECRPLEKTLSYWKREWAWYMAGDRKAEYIQKYASLWSEIKTQDGLLNSNYGWLVFYNQNGNAMNPFKWAMHSLINDKDSRQALITFNTGQFNIVGTKDYICTQYMHFMIRNNQLICFVGLRSSDSIFGLPNNIPFWKFVQLQALIILKNKYPDLKIGFIKVNIDSSHIYGRHFVLVEKMLKSSPKTFNMKLTTEVPLNGNADFYYIRFDDFIKIKEN